MKNLTWMIALALCFGNAGFAVEQEDVVISTQEDILVVVEEDVVAPVMDWVITQEEEQLAFDYLSSGFHFDLPGEWKTEIVQGENQQLGFVFTPATEEANSTYMKVEIAQLAEPMSLMEYIILPVKNTCEGVSPEMLEQVTELFLNNLNFLKDLLKISKTAMGVDVKELDFELREIAGVEALFSRIVENNGVVDSIEYELLFVKGCFAYTISFSSIEEDMEELADSFESMLASIAFAE